MAIFIVLWPYLSTTKLRCLQKNNIGHTTQGGSSYGESEKKVSFESIILSREACGASSAGSPLSTAGRPTNGQNEAAYVLGDTVAIKYVVEPSIDAILLSIEPQKISEKPPRGPMGTCKDSTPDLSLSK